MAIEDTTSYLLIGGPCDSDRIGLLKGQTSYQAPVLAPKSPGEATTHVEHGRYVKLELRGSTRVFQVMVHEGDGLDADAVLELLLDRYESFFG